MTRSASPCPIKGEFDEFLFALIGEVKDDMPLSVLSALARLDVDPWHEAAKLSLLPRACAIQKLATLIAALPETDCARLVALLPCPPRSNAWVRPALHGVDNLTLSQTVINAIVMLFIFLVAQCIVSNHQSPTRNPQTDRPIDTKTLMLHFRDELDVGLVIGPAYHNPSSPEFSG